MNTYDQENKLNNLNKDNITTENIQQVTNCSESDYTDSTIPKLLQVPAKKASNISDLAVGMFVGQSVNKDLKLNLSSNCSNFNRCFTASVENEAQGGYKLENFGIQDRATQTELTGNEIEDLLYLRNQPTNKANIGLNVLSSNSCDLRKVLNGVFKARFECGDKDLHSNALLKLNKLINSNLKLFNNETEKKTSSLELLNSNSEVDFNKETKNFINIKRNPDEKLVKGNKGKKTNNSLFKTKDAKDNKQNSHIHLKHKKEKRKYNTNKFENDLKVSKHLSNDLNENSLDNSTVGTLFNKAKEKNENGESSDLEGVDIEMMIRKLKSKPSKIEKTPKKKVNFVFIIPF
jgi:hypothetical protein